MMDRLNAGTSDADAIVQAIMDDYGMDRSVDRMQDFYEQPNKEVVIDIIDKMMKIIYPGYYRDRSYKSYNVRHHLSTLIEDVMYRLEKQMLKVARLSESCETKTDEELNVMVHEKTMAFLEKIPSIRAVLETDVHATWDGDPAAYSYGEIILAYPGLFAITVYRLAHELYLLQVPLIPRIMTEYAHSITGIDIHPGATIGKYFFIDHGTGIVIGETTVIGEYVKVYQGVTLGALSLRAGQKLKNQRRHPTIEDHVTIYAGASILGGDTIIGHDTVVGSNAFITKPIPPGTRVSMKTQELQYSGPQGTEVETGDWFYMI